MTSPHLVQDSWDTLLTEVKERCLRLERTRDQILGSSLQVSVGVAAMVISSIFLASQALGSGDKLSAFGAWAFFFAVMAAVIVIGCASGIQMKLLRWNNGPESNLYRRSILVQDDKNGSVVNLIDLYENAISKNEECLEWMKRLYAAEMLIAIIGAGLAFLAGTDILTAKLLR